MPASHFDVKPMTDRPKFIVRHSTYNTRLSTRIANRTHARKGYSPRRTEKGRCSQSEIPKG
jgi:hypothetical protein